MLFSSFIYLSLTFLLGLFFSLIVCILINIFDKNKKNKLFIINLIFTLSIFVFKNDCSKRINYLVKKTIYNLNLLHEINDISKSTEENLSENEEINFEIYNDLLPDRNLSSQVYNIALHNTEYTLKNRLLGWGFNAYHRLFDKNIMKVMKKYYVLEYELNMKKHKNYELITLNRNDARSVLLKLINEFGLFAIYFFVIGIKFLLNKSLTINLKLTITTLLITQLISGAGYFNGGFAIFLFLMIILSNSNQKI